MPAPRTLETSVGTLPEGYVFDEDGAIVPVSGDLVDVLFEHGLAPQNVVFA